MKFGIRIVYRNVSIRREFHENRLSDSHTSLKGVNQFLPALSRLLC